MPTEREPPRPPVVPAPRNVDLARESELERIARERGVRLTGARRLIARVLSASTDHPAVATLLARLHAIDPHLGVATLYRALARFGEAGLIDRHLFSAQRHRYELAAEDHHDHLIDIRTGAIVEFQNSELERLQREVAHRLGYRLVDHRCELFGEPDETVPSKSKAPAERDDPTG